MKDRDKEIWGQSLDRGGSVHVTHILRQQKNNRGYQNYHRHTIAEWWLF